MKLAFGPSFEPPGIQASTRIVRFFDGCAIRIACPDDPGSPTFSRTDAGYVRAGEAFVPSPIQASTAWRDTRVRSRRPRRRSTVGGRRGPVGIERRSSVALPGLGKKMNRLEKPARQRQ